MRVLPVICFCTFFLVGCINNGYNNKRNFDIEQTPEILIYCENGLVAPIMEIVALFELQYNCKIRIHNDCARNIISLINFSNNGDLFIPDSYYAISWLKQIDPFIIVDSLYLGENKPVLIVKKGNPLNFDGDLTSLSNEKYAVILSNPETSSLGYETMKLLMNNDIYYGVINNAISLTVDSRGLARSIANGESEVAIDWLASYYTGLSDKIDTINIKIPYESPEIYAALLRNSKSRGLAHSFMAALSTPQSREIFAKHGIIKHKTTIFD